MAGASVPHLDLYNFTDSLAEDSQYVLTSPRSLEACARHGIKPLELLPQSFVEFMEENNVRAHTKDVREVMYKKKKLRVCREERERIIDEKESHQILRKSLMDNESDNESIENINIEDGDTWNVLTTEREDRTSRTSSRNKPSILSFLETSSSPRIRQTTPRTYGETTNEPLQRSFSHHGQSFKLLSGSESDNEDNFYNERESSRREKSAHNNVTQDNSRSTGRLRSARKPPSGRSEKKKQRDLSIISVASDLPENLKKNLSLMSDKDKKLMEIMILRANEEEMNRDIAMSAELSYAQEASSKQAWSKKKSLIHKMKERDDKLNDIFLKKDMMEREAQLQREADLNVKNSKWQREYEKQMSKKKEKLIQRHITEAEKKKRQEENLRQLSRERELWNEVDLQDTMQKLKEHQIKVKTQSDSSFYDPRRAEKYKRAEHNALLADIEDKHTRAQEHFHQQMIEKEMKRNTHKMKEEERKQQRQRQVKVMEKDMDLWKRELSEFQDISAQRATQVVGKRNACKSLKAHNKRLQKELDHAAVKSKLEEDERLRQEELQTIISLKDQRSRLIHQEKEDYAKVSREAARASRAVRDVIKEQAIKSSFANMAADAEKVARIERIGQRKSTPLATTKSRSTIMLG